MIDAILNWFNHQWVLTTFLVFFGTTWIPTLIYLIWDNKRIAKENSRYE